MSNLPFRKQQVENARPKGVCRKEPVEVVGFASPLKVSGQRVRALQSGLREIRGLAT